MRPIAGLRHGELGGAASSYSSDLPSVLLPGDSTQQFYTWTGSCGSGQYGDAAVVEWQLANFLAKHESTVVYASGQFRYKYLQG